MLHMESPNLAVSEMGRIGHGPSTKISTRAHVRGTRKWLVTISVYHAICLSRGFG